MMLWRLSDADPLGESTITVPVNGEPWRFMCGYSLSETLTLPLKLAGWKRVERLDHDFRFAVDQSGTLWCNTLFECNTLELANISMKVIVEKIKLYMPEALEAMWNALYETPNSEVAFKVHMHYREEGFVP